MGAAGRGLVVVVLGLVAVAGAPGAALGETLQLKLLKNYSRATFKSDAPLETFVGNTAADGVDGSMTVDLARPQAATAVIRVDMHAVRTGLDKRDADMRGKTYLDTAVEANRWVTFEVTAVEIERPLEPGKTVPARVKGLLTIKQKAVERVAEATVTYLRLTPEQLEQQKRFGFGQDNVKVRAKLTTTFTDHGMQVPQLLFLKVANELQLEADLTFVRP